MRIVTLLCTIFIGYLIGRISHVIAHNKHIQAVHHWIWGLVIVGAGFIFFHHWLEFAVVGLGIGLIISDLNDMRKLRFYGVEKFEKQKFWDIK